MHMVLYHSHRNIQNVVVTDGSTGVFVMGYSTGPCSAAGSCLAVSSDGLVMIYHSKTQATLR